MNISFLASLTLVGTQSLLAQDTGDPSFGQLSSLGYTISASGPGFRAEAFQVRGSQYFFREWMPGKLTLQDGRDLVTETRYNVDLSNGGGIILLLPEGGAIDVRENLVKRLAIPVKDSIKVFTPIEASRLDRTKEGIWVVESLYEDDKFSFVKRRDRYLRYANVHEAYSSGRDYHEYIEDVEYFIGVDGNYSKVRLKKKSIKKVLPDVQLEGKVTEQKLVEALRASGS